MKTFIYEIYPLSFKSFANRSTGDLRGIASKIPYLQSLGVEYIWITPIFASPLQDNGYDVSDYYSVNPQFGTMNDLRFLINEAKRHQIKIILDMVFNHTATSHPWFKKFKRGNPRYAKYYIYHEGETPPNNWQSKFGGLAWEPVRKGYYLHLFSKGQADLNWDHPPVRQKLKKVLEFYVNLGIQGFRFDVINLISKGSLKNDAGDGRTRYTDGPHVHKYLQELTADLHKKGIFCVGEMSSVKITEAVKYSQQNSLEMDAVFTFHHLKTDYRKGVKFSDETPNMTTFYQLYKQWHETFCKNKAVLANFLNNHDQPRAVNRFAPAKYWQEAAKSQFLLTAFLPGPTFLYQGEEIGMTNPSFSNPKDYRDVETQNYLKNHSLLTVPPGVQRKSRDNARTPMQWDDSKYAGFSATKPWIKIAGNQKQINVLRQINNPNSILSFYKMIINDFKNDPVIKNGTVCFKQLVKNIWLIKRKFQDETHELIISFSETKIEISRHDKPRWFTSPFIGFIMPFNAYIFTS